MSIASEWQSKRLGSDPSIVGENKSILVGGEAFFEQLDEILGMDVSDQTNEWLVVFYTCLGLGFQGMYYDKKEKLQEYMRALWVRCREFMLDDDIPRLIPQPYKATIVGDVVRPPKPKPVWGVLATICLVSAAIGAYMLIYNYMVANKISEPLRSLRNAYHGQLSDRDVSP